MHILAAGKQEETTNFDRKKIENGVCIYLLYFLVLNKARIIWKWQLIIFVKSELIELEIIKKTTLNERWLVPDDRRCHP